MGCANVRAEVRHPVTAGTASRVHSPIQGSRAAIWPGSLLGLSAATVGTTWTVGSLNISTVLLLAAVAVALLGTKPTALLHMRVGWFDWIVVAYALLIVGVENINAQDLHHAPSPGYAYGIVYYITAYVVARLAVSGVDALRGVLIGLTWPGILVAAIGVLQLAGVQPVMSFLLNQTASSSLANRVELGASIRATSTIGHWTSLGAYLCAVVAAACMLLILDRRERGRTSPYAILTIVICALGVISTVTFASILVVGGLIVVSGYVAGVGARITAAIAAVGAVSWLVFGALIGERVEKQSIATSQIPDELTWLPQTIAIRIVLWTTEGVPAWLDRATTGWGLGVWHDSDDWPIRPISVVWPSPESEWMKSLVGSGALGLAGLIVLLIAMHAVIAGSMKGDLGKVSAPLMALFWGFVVASTIAPYFTNQGAPAVLWPLIGAIGWSLKRPEKSQNGRSRETA